MTKKADILKASQSLFAQFGLKKVTTDDIAQEASVSKATIYKLYRNKSEIFDEVVRIEADELVAAIREAVDGEEEVRDKFKAHLLTSMERIHDFINLCRVTQETWGDHWPPVAEIRREFMREEREIVGQILDLGNKRGELAVKDVDVAAHIMVVSLKSLEHPWAVLDRDISLAEYVDIMLDMMLSGIKRR